MLNRIHDLILPASIRRFASSLARKQSSVAVWTIVTALLVQPGALARISASPAPSYDTVDSLLSEAGSVFTSLNTGTRIVRVTDSRDGYVTVPRRINSSSFNLDSSRFLVTIDGVATLYGFNSATLETQKQGPVFGSIKLDAETCYWSAADRDTIIGVEAGTARIYTYNTSDGNYTLLKDFSGIVPHGEAQSLSKSWADDDHFAVTLRKPGSAPRFVAVWDKVLDTTYLFDTADPFSGVPGVTDAHLDRSGEALIVSGEVTRVWRYKTQQQFEATQIEGPDGARVSSSSADESGPFDLITSINGQSDLPCSDLSRDGRLSLFVSKAGDSRSDVYIAEVNAAEAISTVTWTNMVNCAAIANSLQKTGGSNQNDDAYATSTEAASSGDTYVEFIVTQTDKERWCGLNNSNAMHDSSGDINYAIKLANNKRAFVVENGIIKRKIKYKPGNQFRVSVESGVVNYYKNDAVFYTSTASPIYPLLVNASLVDEMAAVEDVTILARNRGTVVSISPAKTTLAAGSTAQFSAIVTGEHDSIVWSSVGGSITNTGFYTAPNVAGRYTVRAACASHPSISATAIVSVFGTSDTTPPNIGGVNSSNITAGGVSIAWNTDEPADTQVEYGTTTSYGNLSTLSPALKTIHSVSLVGLSPSVRYHYRVRSRDAAGNLATSGDFKFTTLAGSGSDTTPPVISSVSASGVAASSATITWTTNEASDTRAEYGTSTGYGSSTALNGSMVTSHSAFVTGLSAGTTYHYRAMSRDAAGNPATSGDFTFTTLTVAPPPPSPPPGIITDHNVRPAPAPPALPRAGGTFVDPTFGTTIMRVTDESDGTSNHNYYSYWPTFNLDSTRFFIVCDGSPRLYRFDTANFQILSKGPLFDQQLPGGGYISTEDATWSATNANVLYGYNGLKLWAYDVAARTYSLVKDFTGEVPAGYLGQMSRSTDDNVFAFSKKDSGYSVTGYLVWQRDQNRILRSVSLGNFDEVQIDKSGRYLVVKADFGGGIDFQIVDLPSGAVQNLSDPAPDFSPGHSDNGRQIVVGHDNWNNQYTVRSLASPHQFTRVISFGNDWSQANHLSMLADDESWCVISNFTAGSGPVGPFREEIFQASTDGSQSVRRLAHHHSVFRDYWDTPRADISRDGRFIAFTSNWGSTTRRDVFIIKVPQGGGGPGPGDTTPPVVSGVAASSLTSSSAAIGWNTNESSDTQVEFGTTSTYGSATSLDTAMTSVHSASITGLAASATYHYRVRSRDAAGNLAVSGDFSFATSATGGGGASAQNVVWTSVTNCTASGNSLLKTLGRDDESDAGAVSQQQLLSGDGYFEFTAGATGKIRFVGLTHSVSGTEYQAIDFAIKLTEFGVAEVRENNAYRIDTTYTGSDVFRVSIESGAVKYYKNGSVFYTSGGAPSYPLRVDAAMLNLGGTVNNAVLKVGLGGAIAVSLKNDQSADVAAQRYDARPEALLAAFWVAGLTLPRASLRTFRVPEFQGT